ncbi:dTMP kinase [Spirillospora sp. CA-294931]|uniref:dTMP kinase n=1 Tax=Spirillospora sp. CA-294931 TaxID=3240042 RepID=UPI003D8CBD83
MNTGPTAPRPRPRPALAPAGSARGRRRRGLLVSFDGPGCAGKTTLAARVAQRLARDNIPHLLTREPSDGPLGSLARTGTHHFHGHTLACLVAADRYHHLDQQIRPALAADAVVLCDRYVLSSHAFQVLDGVDPAFVQALNAHADAPGLAVVLTCEPAELARRLTARGSHGRFEDDPDFPAREHARYRDLNPALIGDATETLHLDSTRTDTESLANTVVTAVHALRSVPGTAKQTTAGDHDRPVHSDDRRPRDP